MSAPQRRRRRPATVVLVVSRTSGSGKTTLIESIVPHLIRRGLRVAAVKRSHHDVELDSPGKDSRRIRDAGADPVVLWGPARLTVFAAAADVNLRRLVRGIDRLGGKVRRRNGDARRQIAARPRSFRRKKSAVEQRIVPAAGDHRNAGRFPHLAGRIRTREKTQRLAQVLLDDFIIFFHRENRD